VTLGRRSALFAALAAGWAATIFAVSSLSHPFPFLPEGLLSSDKLLHAGAYALLAAFVRVALAGTRLRPAAALLLAVGIATLYGASDEIHQAYVPAREPSALDLVADAVGAVAGASAAAVALRRQGRKASIRG
jgi:VanZ family protein